MNDRERSGSAASHYCRHIQAQLCDLEALARSIVVRAPQYARLAATTVKQPDEIWHFRDGEEEFLHYVARFDIEGEPDPIRLCARFRYERDGDLWNAHSAEFAASDQEMDDRFRAGQIIWRRNE